jgi:hypothetical protein
MRRPSPHAVISIGDAIVTIKQKRTAWYSAETVISERGDSAVAFSVIASASK